MNFVPGLINPSIVCMKRFTRSVTYALQGIYFCLKRERNFQIHACAAAAVIIVAVALKCTQTEWLFLLINIAAVLVCEMLNTALEHACNIIQQEIHPTLKIIKDVAAGAVLVSALFAAISGAIIFLPKILMLF